VRHLGTNVISKAGYLAHLHQFQSVTPRRLL